MRRAPLIISILALVLAATGVAVSAPKGADGVIHACFNQQAVDEGGDNTIRLVNAGQACDGDYPDTLTWNASGPAGASGVPGPTGAPGPAGPQGAPAPEPVVPAKQVEKADSAEKQTETAKDKLDQAAEKLQGGKGKYVSTAEFEAFLESLRKMIAQVTFTQQVQLSLLRMMPASSDRDLAIRRAEAQLAQVATVVKKVDALSDLSGKTLTRDQLAKILDQVQRALNLITSGQAAITDGLADRPTNVKEPATKKP